MTLVTGVDFAVVPTKSFDTAVDFYAKVLGLPCTARYGQMPGAEFETGNLTLAVLELEAFGAEFRQAAPIALQVDDVAAARPSSSRAASRSPATSSTRASATRPTSPTRTGTSSILHHRYAPRTPSA